MPTKHEVRVVDELYRLMESIRSGAHLKKDFGVRELKLFDKGIEKLKLNHRAGYFVKEVEHPKPYQYYTKMLGKKPIALWKLDAHPRWRLIYTTVGASEDPEDAKSKPIYCFVIDFLNHNKYNKIFGYKG